MHIRTKPHDTPRISTLCWASYSPTRPMRLPLAHGAVRAPEERVDPWLQLGSLGRLLADEVLVELYAETRSSEQVDVSVPNLEHFRVLHVRQEVKAADVVVHLMSVAFFIPQPEPTHLPAHLADDKVGGAEADLERGSKGKGT